MKQGSNSQKIIWDITLTESKSKMRKDENLVSYLTFPKLGEFHECLERDFLKRNYKFLNCSPPWMTETVDLWCRGKMNITKNAEEFVKIWR